MSRDVLRSADAHVVVDAVTLDAERMLVDDATARHLTRVLRLRDSAIVTATDGGGRWRPTRLEGATAGSISLAADGEIHEESPSRRVTIASAIPKGERLEWMVQKLTEIGVARLRLLHCDRSVVRWKPDRAARQLERLERIAEEALRQSRRVRRMHIEAPVPSGEVLEQFVIAEPGGAELSAQDDHLAIGPEGGWTDEERGRASRSVDLGSGILRIETAALVASTLSVVRNH